MANDKYGLGGTTTFSKLVGNLLIRTLVASVMAFILYASFTIIGVGTMTKEIGYTVLHSEDGQQYEEVYKHYIKDGEDKQLEKYKGKDGYYQTPIRSELTEQQKAPIIWLAQGLSFLIWFGLVYGLLWRAGDADAYRAELGQKSPDRWRGLKAALCAMIPMVLAYLYLIAGKCFGWSGVVTPYKLLTYYGFAFNDIFLPVVKGTAQLSWGGISAAAVNLLFLPVICIFAYYLGEKHFIFKEKILYQKEEKEKKEA